MPDTETARKLEYPLGRNWSPEPGVPHKIVEGVYWLRMPLPLKLDHINLWLLKDEDGWVIVDTGMFDQVCKATWDKIFDTFMRRDEVRRIIVTHFHPDHMGLASWLARECNCKIWISQPEYELYHWIRTRDLNDFNENAQVFLQQAGVGERLAKLYIKAFGEISAAETLPRDSCKFIDEPQALTIGGHEWELVSGNGHSPHHICLYCAELQLMISGDQALPRISSNISVYAESADQDPLLDWLESCRKLQARIPANTLVLPAHQEPFIGIELRMQQLIDGHQRQLDKLSAALAQPINAMQACEALFNRKLDDFGRLMALSETLAHLNYMVINGGAIKTIGKNSLLLYQRTV